MEQLQEVPEQPLRDKEVQASELIFDPKEMKQFTLGSPRSERDEKESFFWGKPSSLELIGRKERTDVPISARRFIMLTLFLFNLAINVEMGSISAAQINIEKDLQINEKDIAFMFSVTYFVAGALTLLMPSAMLRFDARTVLMVSQLCNIVGSFLFGVTSNFSLLLSGRVLNGIA